jgi:hypothetical protein
LREPGSVEITVRIGSNHRFPRTSVHRSTSVGEAVTVDGIACTRVERTLVDLGAVVGEEALESALEAALRRGLSTAARVRAEVDRLARPGRRGLAALRRVLDRRRDGRPTGSDPEVRMIQHLRAAALPTPYAGTRCGSAVSSISSTSPTPSGGLPSRRSRAPRGC